MGTETEPMVYKGVYPSLLSKEVKESKSKVNVVEEEVVGENEAIAKIVDQKDHAVTNKVVVLDVDQRVEKVMSNAAEEAQKQKERDAYNEVWFEWVNRYQGKAAVPKPPGEYAKQIKKVVMEKE